MRNKIPKKKIKEHQKKCVCHICLTENRQLCENGCTHDTGNDSLWCKGCEHQDLCIKLNRREQ